MLKISLYFRIKKLKISWKSLNTVLPQYFSILVHKLTVLDIRISWVIIGSHDFVFHFGNPLICISFEHIGSCKTSKNNGSIRYAIPPRIFDFFEEKLIPFLRVSLVFLDEFCLLVHIFSISLKAILKLLLPLSSKMINLFKFLIDAFNPMLNLLEIILFD